IPKWNGQRERQHADEVHAPYAQPHGDRPTCQPPAPVRCLAHGGDAAGQVQRCIRCQTCNEIRGNNQGKAIGGLEHEAGWLAAWRMGSQSGHLFVAKDTASPIFLQEHSWLADCVLFQTSAVVRMTVMRLMKNSPST